MITLLRNVFGLLLLTPLLLRGTRALRTTRPGLHLLRSALNLGSMLTWFWALPYIVLADNVALMFTGLRSRRWAACCCSASASAGDARWRWRPASPAHRDHPPRLLDREPGLARGAAVRRRLGRYGSLQQAPDRHRHDRADRRSQPPDGAAAERPSVLDDASRSVRCTARSARSRTFSSRGLALADTSFCMPFDFTGLPFAAAIAYPLFGRLPDLWTVLGALVIFAAAFSIATRERR